MKRPTKAIEKPRHRLCIAMAVGVICGVSLICAYLLSRQATPGQLDDAGASKGKVKRQESVKTRPATRTAPAPDKKADAASATVDTGERELWLGLEVKEHRVVTNGTLVVETFITADGNTHKYYHDEMEGVLPSAADQVLAMITASDDGFGAPPLPRVEHFEDDFGEALKREIVIYDSDSAAVKALKERVITARKELLELMAQGVDANAVVAEYAKAQQDNATIRLDAAKGVQELLDVGDIDAARELCAKYNEVLEQANIMSIEIPEDYLKQEENN